MTGHHRVQPGAPPVREPLLHGSLASVDHFSDDARVSVAGGVEKNIDDSLRRITNQAFFDTLHVQTDGHPDEPFNIFFDPDVQQLATTRQRAVETGAQTGQVVGLNNDHLVDPAGLEPTTDAV